MGVPGDSPVSRAEVPPAKRLTGGGWGGGGLVSGDENLEYTTVCTCCIFHHWPMEAGVYSCTCSILNQWSM